MVSGDKTMTKKVVTFEKNGLMPSVVTPADTNLSVATAYICTVYYAKKVTKWPRDVSTQSTTTTCENFCCRSLPASYQLPTSVSPGQNTLTILSILAVFRQRLKTFLFSRSYPDIVS